MSTPDLRAGDLVVIRGNSLTSSNGGPDVAWPPPLATAVRALFTGGSPATPASPARYTPIGITSFDRGCPTFINQGHAGDTASVMLGDLATRVYPYNPTGVIIECGINDVTNGTSAVSFQASVTAIANGVLTASNYPHGVAPRWLLWVGPLANGELRPFGSNANDTTPPAADADHTIASKESILRARAPLDGFTLVQFHTDAAGNGSWLTYETANNPSNLATGILTTDGRHLTAAGASFMSAQVLAAMTVVVA